VREDILLRYSLVKRTLEVMKGMISHNGQINLSPFGQSTHLLLDVQLLYL
jgi:hypothetical protein